VTRIQILYGKAIIEKMRNDTIYNCIKVKLLKIASILERIIIND